ncbi:MAG: hypothetical protein GY791_06395 [Alphaproteobacteria bacterium]|nr:hypothetical protein [Alphaproteobacteria bacterium]
MRGLFLALAVVVGFVLGGIADARSQTPEPSQAELQAEYDRLFQQMFRDPSNLDLTFKFAAVANKLGNFESAISALERMLLINPNLPRVKLELGVLYYRLAAYAIAKSYFESAIAGGDAPALVIERVNFYTEEIDRRLSRHNWTGAISAGFRGQSNANAGPSSNLVRVLGNNATLDDQFLGQPDGNIFTGGNVTHSYDFRNSIVDSWQTDGTAFYTHQFTFDQLDLAFGEVRTGPLFLVDPDLANQFSVRPYVTSNVLALGELINFYSYGAGVRVFKLIDTVTSMSADFQYRHQVYINTSARPLNSELTNDGPLLQAAVQHFVTLDTSVGLNFTFSDEEATMNYNSNTEYIIAGFASFQYPPPMDLTNWPWRLDVSALGALTDYDAPDPSVDPLVTRQDREWRVNVVNTIGFSREWSAFLQLGYTENQSNLPNFTFQNLSGVVGVRKSFF